MRLLAWIIKTWFLRWMALFLDPSFDQISASTLADLKDDVVYDCFFVDGATLRKARASGALDEYQGGTIMQTPFMYDRVNGGAVAPGTDVNVMQKQILAATAFVPKEYVEQVPLNLWQTNVINNGPAGKVKIVDMYMTNAVMAANTDINIDLFRHGQPNSATVTTNRSIFINGAAEAMNDGINNSWDGNVYTTYGGQLRNGAVSNTLNAIPIWMGDQAGNPGQITYKPILEMYLNCVQEPDIGVTNKAAFAYLLEREEVKQRFHVEVDASIGLSGIKVLNAYIMMDKLAPSTKYGTILPSGLSQTTAIKPSVFTTATLTAAQRAISNLPSATLLSSVGEVFFWFRMKGWKVRPATDPEYNFNFTPPVRSQTNPDLIVMFFKLGINFYTTSPRDNAHGFGIGF